MVSEFETREQAMKHLDIPEDEAENLPEFLNISWFTDSIKAKKPVDILNRHRIPSLGPVEEVHVHILYFVKKGITQIIS